MRVSRLAFGAVLAVCAINAAGCNTAAGGGALGAGLGALGGLAIGSVTGGAGTGAVIGAVAGGLGGAVIGDQNGRNENGGQDPGWFGEKKRPQQQGYGTVNGQMTYTTTSVTDRVWNHQTGQYDVVNSTSRTTGTGTTTAPMPHPPAPGGN